MTQLSIDRLGIENLRGITGGLELDLRSPLTLLYAANGTAKTTVCDAAEWLLTGMVDRLSTTATSFDPEVMRSRFTSTTPPRVEADIRIDGQPFHLERTIDGARGREATGVVGRWRPTSYSRG